jgi:5'-deoxynucleotidase YfbR-like HD superfamily hydrolase
MEAVMNDVVYAFGGLRAVRAFLDLNAFINEFKAIERGVEFAGGTSKERNAEHTFQVVFIAWALNASEKLSFDPHWLMLVAMFHDFVEYLRGDTPMFPETFRGDAAPDSVLKRAKEEEGFSALKNRFGERYPEMLRAMRCYLDETDETATFVSALGKLIVVTNIYQDEGRSWRTRGIPIEVAYERHLPGASKHPLVKRMYEEVWALIRQDAANRPNLYSQDLLEKGVEKRRSD